jgi:hypothetical protein
MPVISNPTYNPTSAYQPVEYEVFYTASPDIVKYCQFTIFVNGNAIATARKTYYKTNVIFGSVEYYFKIDIQEYLQRWLAPNREKSTMFGTLGAATQVDNIDAYGEVYVEFEYFILSASTGLIYEAPSFDTSDLRIVDMATRQNGEDRSLDEFVWVPAVTPARFLSNMPLEQTICSQENAFVSFLSDWNWFRLQTYNAAGTQLSDVYAPTGNLGNIAHTTVGTGVAQLQAVTYHGGFSPVFTGAAYYVITFGSGFIATPTTVVFLGNPIQKAYRIDDCCGSKLKLYWLNALGGVDNFSFVASELNKKVEGDVFEKPLVWPHKQEDFGRTLVNIKAVKAYQIKAQLTNENALWIRELFHSAEIYMQNPSGALEYWRAYITPATFQERAKKGFFEIEFELNLSQDVVTHRV